MDLTGIINTKISKKEYCRKQSEVHALIDF